MYFHNQAIGLGAKFFDQAGSGGERTGYFGAHEATTQDRKDTHAKTGYLHNQVVPAWIGLRKFAGRQTNGN